MSFVEVGERVLSDACLVYGNGSGGGLEGREPSGVPLGQGEPQGREPSGVPLGQGEPQELVASTGTTLTGTGAG